MSEWIEHHGKGMPVSEDTIVAIRFKCGVEMNPTAAKAYAWRNDCGGWDISAYRITNPAAAPPPPG